MRDELRSTLTLAFATGVSSLFRIAYVVYAGRVLGPAEYADLYAALSVTFLFAAGLAPIASSITRFLSLFRGRGEEGKILAMRRTMPRRVNRWSLILFGVGLALSWPLHVVLRFESPSTALLLAVILPLNLQVDTPRGILRGVQRFRSFGWNLAGESALRLVLCVALFVFVAKAPAALVAHLLAAIVIVFVGHRQIATVGEGAEEQPYEQRQIELFMIPLFLFAFLGALYQNLDVLFVKRLFDGVDAGQFSAISALAKLVGLALLPFSILVLPLVTTSFARGEAALKPLFRAVAGFLAASAAIVVGYRFFGDVALRLLYGEEYLGAVDLLVPLTIATVIASVSVLVGQAFAAMNRFAFLKIYAGGVVLQIGLMVLGRGSMRHLVYAVLAAQAVTLVALGVELVRTQRGGPAARGAEAGS